MILIVGGTGTLGSKLAARLTKVGQHVRVMSRDQERARNRVPEGAEIVVGDLLDPASLVRACTGVEVVVAAAHSMFGAGKHASARVDGEGHRTLIDAAKSTGVKHFVYTSVYDHGPPFSSIPFFRIKLEVEDYLKRSGLAFTILRPTAFIEIHAHLLIGQPILTGKRTLIFGRGDRPRNFVAAEDVARVGVLAVRDHELIGKTVDVAGPGNHTSLEVVRLYEHFAGRKARVIHLPAGLLSAASSMLRPVHPGISQVVQTGVLGERLGQAVRHADASLRFGFQPTRLDDWISANASVPPGA